ncbi:MAG: hypothetical protein HY929_04240 [Euryarchaeota archaeon]|nr:hypothetical protein [Euryarchaeota archaeon]
MLISLDLELKDIPGQLVSALKPIAKFGGNIVSIVHLREKKTLRGYIPVHFVFEIEDGEKLKKLLKTYQESDIRVLAVNEAARREKTTVILIGHVVDTDARDTIDRLNEIQGVMVADLDLEMPHPEKESSARMTIEATSKKEIDLALKKLDEVAQKKNLLVIKSLEVSF